MRTDVYGGGGAMCSVAGRARDTLTTSSVSVEPRTSKERVQRVTPAGHRQIWTKRSENNAWSEWPPASRTETEYGTWPAERSVIRTASSSKSTWKYFRLCAAEEKSRHGNRPPSIKPNASEMNSVARASSNEKPRSESRPSAQPRAFMADEFKPAIAVASFEGVPPRDTCDVPGQNRRGPIPKLRSVRTERCPCSAVLLHMSRPADSICAKFTN